MDDEGAVARSYRDKAERCRRLARQTTDREIAQRLIELAQEFEQQALNVKQREGCEPK